MSLYQLFGQCLESDLLFPELEPGSGPTHWVLTTVAGREDPPAGSVYLGEDNVVDNIRVRLYRTPAGFWLDFEDSGCFAVTDGGRTLRWHRPVSGRDGFDVDVAARLDVQGRVLALALHAEGRLCLHGSGVCTGGVGLGFLAPKFHGKSTLALALVSAGARLITDDTLVVDPAAVPLALPGVHSMRLWDDSASQFLPGRRRGAAAKPMPLDGPSELDPASNPDMRSTPGAQLGSLFADGDKLCLHALSPDRRMHEPAPLDALYLLAPTRAIDSAQRPAAARTRLSPTAAALALVGHGKLTPLLGRANAVVALNRAIAVARAVPVYTLSVVRDFDRLQEVVEQLLEWHGDSRMSGVRTSRHDVAPAHASAPRLVAT